MPTSQTSTPPPARSEWLRYGLLMLASLVLGVIFPLAAPVLGGGWLLRGVLILRRPGVGARGPAVAGIVTGGLLVLLWLARLFIL